MRNLGGGRGLSAWCEFTDTYGNRVRLQDSSSAEGVRFWVMCKGADGATTSPHLSLAQVRRLRDGLQRVLEAHGKGFQHVPTRRKRGEGRGGK